MYVRHDFDREAATIHASRTATEQADRVEHMLHDPVQLPGGGHYPTQDMICDGNLCCLRFGIVFSGLPGPLSCINMYRIARTTEGDPPKPKVTETWFGAVSPGRGRTTAWPDSAVRHAHGLNQIPLYCPPL